MGLDMYLFANRYMWFNEDELKDQVAAPFDLPEGVRPKSLQVEVGYWRKANHIHAWFVNNVQEGKDDCGNYYVSAEDLDKLLDACNKVLEDHGLAETLLPTQSGFFFGGTEYDEYYFNDIKDTVAVIKRAKEVLAMKGWDLEYHSSW